MKVNSCELCLHFLPDGGSPACHLGRSLNECGPGCSAYLEDSERTPCEVWDRVMGYHRPTSAFNAGKQQEYKDRVRFKFGKENKVNG